MEQVNTSQRLTELRQLMKEAKIDIWVTPSEDAHQSEYTAACDARRSFISGFSGSAGTAVVTLDKAALATDGRYFNQAAQQLDSNWTLLKQGLEDVPTWQDWAAEQSEGGKVVGIDSTLFTSGEARKLKQKIEKRGGKDLRGLTENLVDKIWKERPSRPSEPVQALDIQYSGESFHEKLDRLRKELEKRKVAGMVISMLDDVAWLFNLRGNDIPYNPVFFAYATVTPNSATLFVDESKLSPDVKTHLGDSVHIRPYDAILGDLEALSKSKAESGAKSGPVSKFLISNKASWALQLKLGGESSVEEARSPVTDAKAVKNKVELEGMRRCHIRDGAALSEFFAWLEEELTVKGSKIDEVQAADALEDFRKKQDLFIGLSFDTISSTGANAAIIHYKPEPGLCSVIDPKQVYLCDSGAQYLDGTTDTTRTIHFGEPTEFEKKANTLVLKGMIAVGGVVFPKGTNGMALDSMARQHLWKEGLDYRHGTGHGVGSYLNVHEGPIGIGTRVAYAEVPLSVGNVISDEPGYYEDGNFGIRIENIIMVKEVKTTHSFGDKPFLSFEHVTMTPLCRKLIDEKLLTSEEKKWVDEYHQEIWEKTSSFFKNDERTMKWLKRECAPL